MSGGKIEKICFIAPSTGLLQSDRKAINRTIRALKNGLGAKEIFSSPHLFSFHEKVDYVSASIEDRLNDFRSAIKDYDLIISVAGGTGAEDLALKIDKKDFQMIRERKPIFMGFSDFTFLLNEIYFSSRAPVVHFSSLTLGKGNFNKIFSLILGKEIYYRGSFWLTPSPARKFSGTPIGGNFSTFANFLNRINPPKLNWKKHILFIEDVGVDNEDLHRSFAALSRHNVFEKIKCIVIGSLCEHVNNSTYQGRQRGLLKSVKNYLTDIIKKRRDERNPLPILVVSNFGHNIVRDLMAVPIGGDISISKGKKIIFSMKKPKKN